MILCEANILFLWVFLFYFNVFPFDWVGLQLLTLPDWPQIFWQVPQAFSTCISSFVNVFYCVLVVERIYFRLGGLSFFFFSFLIEPHHFSQCICRTNVKGREADSCKYACKHRRLILKYVLVLHLYMGHPNKFEYHQNIQLKKWSS